MDLQKFRFESSYLQIKQASSDAILKVCNFLQKIIWHVAEKAINLVNYRDLCIFKYIA